MLSRSDVLSPRIEGCGLESVRKNVMRFSSEASLEEYMHTLLFCLVLREAV